MPIPLATMMGADFVGVVVALGEHTSRFASGDRVMTISTRLGAYAERIAVDEAILSPGSAEFTDIDAATLPMPASTAWKSLHTVGDVRSGMRILVHGASGTVGAFARAVR